MQKLKSLEEANAVDAVRLTEKRQIPRVGDIFRFSPAAGLYGWGRLVERGEYIGPPKALNLVYIYDAWGRDLPSEEKLSPQNLLIGPVVVNNLGWSRGYWEVIENRVVGSGDRLARHVFRTFLGAKRELAYVDEYGKRIRFLLRAPEPLSNSGIGNFNSVDWEVRQILRERGVL